jgi:glycosyltransferase involved in cell wall biosynthesis
VAGAVQFLGWREDVPTLMARASIHCCPSLPQIREAFGLVVLEAKLAGLPSVVTPSGYLPELVSHQVDGWRCASATAEALAEGLDFFLTDSQRTQLAGRAARESSRAFNPESYAEAWHRVFA